MPQLLLERGGELLRSLELLAMEMLRLPGNEHEKISFDCMGHRKARLEELRMSARVAADKVRQSRHALSFCADVFARTPHCCIWHCAMSRICTPKATAKACAGLSCSIRRIIGRRNRGDEDRLIFVFEPVKIKSF